MNSSTSSFASKTLKISGHATTHIREVKILDSNDKHKY